MKNTIYITTPPPPELVEQWVDMLASRSDEAVFSLAAQWGADQELEAIQKEIITQAWFVDPRHRLAQLRAARRPKPPSLKEQALEAVKQIPVEPNSGPWRTAMETIIRALEALPDD